MPQDTDIDVTVPDEDESEQPAKKAKRPAGSARPNDIPLQEPALPNSSFSTRANRTRAERFGAQNKVVEPGEADTK